MNTHHGMNIIDIGCGPSGKNFENFVSSSYNILGIDLLDKDKVKIEHPKFKYLKKDATDLSSFKDKEFQLAISIGMMEHICDKSSLKSMVDGINRIAEEFVIIVPWKYAVIEPHFKFPLFPLLPYLLKVLVTRLFNLHGLRNKTKRDYYYIKNHYQWFSNRKWKDIFNGTDVFILPFFDTIAIIKRKIKY